MNDSRHNPVLFVFPDVVGELRPPEQEEASEEREKDALDGRFRQIRGDFHQLAESQDEIRMIVKLFCVC